MRPRRSLDRRNAARLALRPLSSRLTLIAFRTLWPGSTGISLLALYALLSLWSLWPCGSRVALLSFRPHEVRRGLRVCPRAGIPFVVIPIAIYIPWMAGSTLCLGRRRLRVADGRANPGHALLHGRRVRLQLLHLALGPLVGRCRNLSVLCRTASPCRRVVGRVHRCRSLCLRILHRSVHLSVSRTNSVSRRRGHIVAPRLCRHNLVGQHPVADNDDRQRDTSRCFFGCCRLQVCDRKAV